MLTEEEVSSSMPAKNIIWYRQVRDRFVRDSVGKMLEKPRRCPYQVSSSNGGTCKKKNHITAFRTFTNLVKSSR